MKKRNVFYSKIPSLVDKIKTRRLCSIKFKRRSDGKISEVTGKFLSEDLKNELLIINSDKGIRSIPVEGIRQLKLKNEEIDVLV